VKVLTAADVLVLAEVYAAGEAPIAAADGRSLAEAVTSAKKQAPVFVEDVAGVPDAIRRAAKAGDVVLTMGAGSIGAVAGQLSA
jgi:UDP-N-acetylmuramate--alanine ligase